MTKQQEDAMVTAHAIGRSHAERAHEVLRESAKLWFKTEDERDSFLAGYIGELRRLSQKGGER